MADVITHKSRTDRRRIFKLGGLVDQAICHAWPLSEVKMSKVKVMKRNSSKNAITRQRFDRSPQKLARRRILAVLTPPAFKIWILNTKMAVEQNLEKSKNAYISATIWPIDTTFGIVMHSDHPNPTGSRNFKPSKIQDGGRPPSWKIEK